MSKIQKILEKIVIDEDSKFVVMEVGGSRQDYLNRLLREVDKVISDDLWDGLSEEEQAWINTGVKALEAQKDIPEFSDYVEPIQETTTEETGSSEEVIAQEELKEGMSVAVHITDIVIPIVGDIVEVGRRYITLLVEKEEVDIRIININKVVKSPPKVETTVSQESETSEIDSGLVLTAKDAVEGKNYKIDNEGTVVSAEFVRATERGAVFEDHEGERYRIALDDAIEEVETKKIVKKEEKVETKIEKKSVNKVTDKEKRSSKKVSAIYRIKELMCQTVGITKEAVQKQIITEGLKCSESTITTVFRDTEQLLGILESLGKLK